MIDENDQIDQIDVYYDSYGVEAIRIVTEKGSKQKLGISNNWFPTKFEFTLTESFVGFISQTVEIEVQS